MNFDIANFITIIKLLYLTSRNAHEASLHFKALKHSTGADESERIRGEKRGEKETVERGNCLVWWSTNI